MNGPDAALLIVMLPKNAKTGRPSPAGAGEGVREAYVGVSQYFFRPSASMSR
jgi:hypothetical protein